jgi:hypothetical protein
MPRANIYEWNVTEPDVHINGDTAWIAYVNKGRISDGSGTISQQWLESAFLQMQALGSRIRVRQRLARHSSSGGANGQNVASRRQCPLEGFVKGSISVSEAAIPPTLFLSSIPGCY